MGSALKNKQGYALHGILFQIPVFILGAFGLSRLLELFYYSLTDFNMLSAPSWIGFENYSRIFKEDLVQKGLGNTIVMVCIVTVLLLLTAVLPALFIAKLKLPFGIGVAGAFCVISMSVMLPNFLRIFFSADSYGILNGILLDHAVIHEPIAFAQAHGMLLATIILWLYCLAPVFCMVYIAARMKRRFLGAAIAVCAIPIFMYSGGSMVTGVVGYPSTEYSADWFYTIFHDYFQVRFDIGFAYAILFVGLIMLIGWCLIVCLVTYGVWRLCQNVKAGPLTMKAPGYITFSLAMLLFLVVAGCLSIYLLKAFMPPEEWFVHPNHYMPIKPTFKNFSDLPIFLSNSFTPFSHYLRNSLCVVPAVILPICFLVAVPSGVGFGLSRSFKKQPLLLLCFIPFLFTNCYVTLARLGIVDSYLVYMFEFLSSFEFLIVVFLAYLTVKLVFYDRKWCKGRVLLGIAFMISSCYAMGAIRGIWYSSSTAIYSEQLKTWGAVSGYISRTGMAAANDMLMLLATIAVLIVPTVLLLTLYRLYRNNTKNLLT